MRQQFGQGEGARDGRQALGRHIPSVCVEGREERGLKRVIIGALAKVTVHLASGTEDTLNTCGGCGGGTILLDHLGQVGPLRLLDLSRT